MGHDRQFYEPEGGEALKSDNSVFDVTAWREDINTKIDSLLESIGSISTVNSTSTLLTNGSTFTGTWEDVTKYSDVIVAVKTDQNGTFQVQYSPDGTNVDSSLTRYYRTNQIEAPHRFTNTRQFMRVVFTNNSGADQTFLRLQTILGKRNDLNAPLDLMLAQDFDSISVRPSDFHTEVALGRRQGATTWNKFGYNTNVSSASPELIASWGGTFQYLTTGETIDIVSTSTDDVVTTGTGARGIVIYGVDENWEEQVEVVNLNGTTTVTTSSQWIGINRISVYLAGSGKQNAGTISVTATTAGYDMAEMPATQGTSQQMIFYVPVGHNFLAQWLHFNALKTSGGSKPEVEVLGYVYSAVSNAEYEVYRGAMDIFNANDIDVNPPVPFVIAEKSILWFNCDTDTSSTSIKGRFSGELVRSVDT
jgi:hypothetical protein